MNKIKKALKGVKTWWCNKSLLEQEMAFVWIYMILNDICWVEQMVINKKLIDACNYNKNEFDKFINWFNKDFIPKAQHNDKLTAAYMDALLEILDRRMPGIENEIIAKKDVIFKEVMA